VSEIAWQSAVADIRVQLDRDPYYVHEARQACTAAINNAKHAARRQA
jgi:hypothetical protein